MMQGIFCDKREVKIANYKEIGGLGVSLGGERTHENLAKEHTDKAISKMKEILDKMETVLRMCIQCEITSNLFESSDLKENG